MDWSDASAWLQGLFGGAAATLLWEIVIKPVRERRSLAHSLASEVGHNLEQAAAHRLLLEREPKNIPADFALSDLVFKAVASRIGELPQLTGDIVLLYRRGDGINVLVSRFAELVDELRALEPRVDRFDGPAPRLRTELGRIVTVYRTSLESFIDDANSALPKLRAAASPWYRLDILFRRQRLSLSSIASKLDGHRQRLSSRD